MIGGAADASSGWWADPDLLLATLRRAPVGEGAPQIAGYDELRELRRGGQGVVYVARQRSTNRQVAIKLLLGGSHAPALLRRRFEREIELVASLRHPHIVQVYDSGVTADGRLYLVMEYVPGVPLEELLPAATAQPPRAAPAGAREVRAALALFVPICEAVDFAHRHGVIHRDLKPRNVRVDPQGRPHVLDFGLAKLAGGAAESAAEGVTMSQPGQFIGSLPWASPEQAEGAAARADTRTDVYALGVMLFQALTGRFPYDVSGSLAATLRHILETPPARPRALNPAVDDELETIVLKCLAKSPDLRYQTAGELGRDLRRYLAGEPIEAKRESTWYVLRKTARRYRTATLFSAAFVVLLVAALVVSLSFWRAAERRRLFAEQAQRAEQSARQAATAVSDFLTNMLASVDPESAHGQELTVRELLDRAAQRVPGRFTDQPLVEATLRNTIGMTYLGLGDYATAEPHIRQAYELRVAALGAADERTLWTANDLVRAWIDLDRLEAAQGLLGASAALAGEHFGPDHPLSLVLAHQRAYLAHCRGELDAAAAQYRVALARRQGLSSAPDDQTQLVNNFAALLLDQGAFVEVIELLEPLLAQRRERLGPDHPMTLNCASNLAVAYEEVGRVAEAEGMQRQLVDDMRRVLGAEHPKTLTHTLNWASTLGTLGRLEESALVTRKMLAVSQRTLGPDSSLALRATNDLGHRLILLKRYAEAETLLTEAFTRLGALFGEDDQRTLRVAQNLAGLFQEQGDFERAAEWGGKLVDTRTRVLGAGHPETLTAQYNLATLRLEHGRVAEAEPLLRQVVSGLTAALGAEHWLTGVARARLGQCLMLGGTLDAAQTELEAALAVVSAALGPEHERTRRVEEFLAELARARAGKADSGEARGE